ncbi:uncharacterized protein LOC114279463 isoform X2 [Camellia sinensis]|uniref:uncharacterized protein LOC114279463 isoform X2 n=1 Tax=Camellia sinensis TaxID=4442 RepID=UPI001036A000|nr:uncharacterized protein LOC114279463 isoform X2 [Camellia sinensis]
MHSSRLFLSHPLVHLCTDLIHLCNDHSLTLSLFISSIRTDHRTADLLTDQSHLCLSLSHPDGLTLSHSGSKLELEQYLSEVEHFVKNQAFEILDYWKVNATKYRVLSQLARDVLAMPISTVASESAFSTGGRILDPFCSSLLLSMVEALVCTQNWLQSNLPISFRKAMDDVEEFEQYDSGKWKFIYLYFYFCYSFSNVSFINLLLLTSN